MAEVFVENQEFFVKQSSCFFVILQVCNQEQQQNHFFPHFTFSACLPASNSTDAQAFLRGVQQSWG